jgi:hypothetical protein
VTLKDAKHRRKSLLAAPRGRSASAASYTKNTWRLPSGKRLAEFALESGFLAPHLMEHHAESNEGEKKLP